MLRFILSLFLASSTLGFAQDHARYYDEGWLKINQYSPVEGFHSHGSFGWHLGVGAIRTDNSGEKGDKNLPPTQVPRLFLVRGTPWQLDFGLTYARLDNEGGRQMGGHAQWTLFEGFQKPAVAIRISRMQADGVAGLAALRTDSAILGISYGIFRFLGFSLGVGQQRHHLDVKPMDEDNAFGLAAGEEEQIDKTESIWSVGFRLHLFSPFASIGIERIYTHPQEALTIAKLSYML